MDTQQSNWSVYPRGQYLRDKFNFAVNGTRDEFYISCVWGNYYLKYR